MKIHNRTRIVVLISEDDVIIINRIKNDADLLEWCPCCTKHARKFRGRRKHSGRKRKLAKQDRRRASDIVTQPPKLFTHPISQYSRPKHDYHILNHYLHSNGNVEIREWFGPGYSDDDAKYSAYLATFASNDERTGVQLIRQSIQADDPSFDNR